jgi:hypothetical protein
MKREAVALKNDQIIKRQKSTGSLLTAKQE